MKHNANKHCVFLPRSGLQTFPNDSDAVVYIQVDTRNNLRAEFIKRVVGARERGEKVWKV